MKRFVRKKKGTVCPPFTVRHGSVRMGKTREPVTGAGFLILVVMVDLNHRQR
jgi:hypothetical protein